MGPLTAISFIYALRQKVGELYIRGQFHQCFTRSFYMQRFQKTKNTVKSVFLCLWDGKIDPWSQFHQHLTQVFLYESKLSSFSLIPFDFAIFWRQNIGKKNVHVKC
jgi:hypothetical protein